MGWDQLVPHGPVEMLLCLGVALCIVVLALTLPGRKGRR